MLIILHEFSSWTRDILMPITSLGIWVVIIVSKKSGYAIEKGSILAGTNIIT